MAQTYLCFDSSRQAVRQVEMAHDFFGGSLVALRNLSWQVRGFRDSYPNLSQEDVVARFAGGFDSGGTNALTLVTERTWPEQERLLSELRLVNGVSIFESWCDSIVAETLSANARPKDLQFPATILRTLASMGGGHSSLMKTVQTKYGDMRLHKPAAIKELAICFRAFKEARNCLAHGGGLASPEARAAWLNYERDASNWTKKAVMRARPELPEVIVGQPVQLTTRGVIGFVASLQVLISTCDGVLAGSKSALNLAGERWKNAALPPLNMNGISKTSDKALGRFGHRWARLGFPALGKDTRAMFTEFEARGLV